MKILHFILLPVLLAASIAAGGTVSTAQHEVGAEKRQEEFSLKKRLMLDGYDVVSYQQAGGPKKGSRDFEIEYKGVRYRFANEANKVEFLSNPERYEPLYGGWCAYAMLDGEKTKANPKSFKVVDGHLLVFYDGLWGDTLKMWNEKLDAETTDEVLLKTADREWEKILEK